tara:strand:- start:9085 stop:9600 length:516 start_codon:yes stop_codon:yes gene_type:complete
MSTSQIFASLQEEYNTATADQGLGSLGEWPPAGNHECYVLGMTIDDNASFRQSSDGQEFPSIMVQFEYQLVDDPDRSTPLIWKGAPFNLIKDSGNLTHDGSKTRTRIEMERFKGHLKTLMGGDMADLPSAIDTVQSKFNGDSAVVAMIRCQYNQKGTRTYKTEYIQYLVGN